MNAEDKELLDSFVAESRELLERAEVDLLALDGNAAEVDPDAVHRIFRAVHSVKGAAGFFGLHVMQDLAHTLESVLMRVRDGELPTDCELVDVLLAGNDQLSEMLDDVVGSNTLDVSREREALQRYLVFQAGPAPVPDVPPPEAPAEPAELDAEPDDEPDDEPTDDQDLPFVGEAEPVFEEPPEKAWAGAEAPVPLDSGDDLLAAESPVAAEASPVAPARFRGAEDDDVIAEIGHPAQGGRADRDATAVGAAGAASGKAEETIRVKTSTLNALMEMAGEMVLARNRLVRRLEESTGDNQGLASILHEVSGITTDLQEEIMKMRLQPVGALFGRFHRVVRDLSRRLDKEVALRTIGVDVELDRTLLEGLADPMTHLVRNSLDHGIEPPNQREAKGKPRQATLTLQAVHRDGMVHIEVTDDGRGIDVEKVKEKALQRGLLTIDQAHNLTDPQATALLFAPGFSTASAITEVSGRGVGLDVVRTNIEKLGGEIDLRSHPGEGTIVCLKLPLTLAIVSALIVEAAGDRFVLPQVNLEKVIRLKPGESSEKIEKVRGADVLRYRGELLLLVRLSSVLGLKRFAVDPETGGAIPERRERIADRRAQDGEPPEELADRRSGEDRRKAWTNVERILVVRAGPNRFGLMVDQIDDTEEIVVKPLSSFVRGCPCFSGATILGDGTIAMILDPVGIARKAGLRFDDLAIDAVSDTKEEDVQGEAQQLLLFTLDAEEQFALPLGQIERVEKVEASKIQRIGQGEFVEYRGSSLPLLRVENFLDVQAPMSDADVVHVLVPRKLAQPVGIVTRRVLDTPVLHVEIDDHTIAAQGLVGSFMMDRKIVLMLDIFGLIDSARPDRLAGDHGLLAGTRLLVAEDTGLCQAFLREYLTVAGAEVEVVADGMEAWGRLESEPFDAVLTDIAMPRLDGPGLFKRVRARAELAGLPVIGLTAQLSEQEVSGILELGFDAVAHKLLRSALARTIHTALRQARGSRAA